MNRRTQDAILIIRIISDLAMLTIAWILAYYIRFSGFIPTPKGIPSAPLYWKMIPFIWTIWVVVLAASGFYRRTGRHRSPFVEGLDILQSCFLATMAFIAFTYVYEEYRYSRLTMLLFVVVHPWMIISGRSLIRKTLRFYRTRSTPRRTLIIGSGDCLRHAVEMGHVGDLSRGEIMGVILVGSDEQIEQGKVFCDKHTLKIIPVQDDWPRFFSENATESVVMALPHRQYTFLDHHLEDIANQVPDVKLIPDLLRYTRFAAGVDVVNGTPVVSIHESPLGGMGSILKRLMDIAGAAAMLLIFGPFMVLIAIVIKLTSRGPILYKQERMGLDGRTFQMLKFRTMPVDAEKKTGAVWASKEDNRATPIGRWLRRTSVDELPQIFNVLFGEMSLVGPRPERPVFVHQFRCKVPGYYLRHKTKAGLTGWAQVNGWRGNTSIEKRIECDLFYIQNWSVWFDIRILLLTILKGFINKNAY